MIKSGPLLYKTSLKKRFSFNLLFVKVSRSDSLKTIPKKKQKKQNPAVDGFLTVDMDLYIYIYYKLF